MVNGIARTQVALADLAKRERFKVYWACYWRAVLFVVAQILFSGPCMYLSLLLFGHVDPFGRPDGGSGLWGLLLAESASALIGFSLASAFVRMIVKTRVGGDGEEKVLRRCYRNSLALALDQHRSVR